MALVDEVTLARDPGFASRVTMAAVFAAVQIANEAVNADFALYYAKRQALAVAVLNNPQAYSERFSWLVAANPAITEAATDNDIQFTVNTAWDALAGVSTADKPV